MGPVTDENICIIVYRAEMRGGGGCGGGDAASAL